ncbi:MAG: ribonuclease HI [Alphaproteobacteria bacterium]|nr:ribonuclease HI [Alphaproteobacteria bacterium]
MSKIVIFTDGSCLGNPGPGGWAYATNCAQKSGGEKMTTNNRMELLAVINALADLPAGSEVEINTDSQYVKNGMELWIKNWKRRGFRNSQGDKIKNQDLWIQLDEQAAKHKVSWTWVRGHVGNEMNELVDALARAAAENI